jgi:uncharacterized protein with FMN-binding domain
MRRVAIATTSTVAGVLLLLSLKPHSPAAAIIASPRSVATPTPTRTSTSSPASPGGGPNSATAGSGGKSGTLTGDAIDTRYGPVQVAATLSNGKLTAVKVLQVPDDGPREDMIVSDDVPQLTQEALAAGGAQIDSVSGATYTSEGYIQSLQSALDKARA